MGCIVMSNSTFKELYSADIVRYGGHPNAYIKVFLFLFRKASTEINPFFRKVYRVLFGIWSNRRGIEMSSNQSLGGGIYIGHANNITINPQARIGRNCNIHKGVIIGQTNRGTKKGAPTIGDNVWIGVNAAIVGKITIGNDVLIAPNSFVNIDVPSHSVVFGNPCIIKHKQNATEGYINHIL